MLQQDWVLKTFIVYICVKAMLFAPFVLMAVWVKMNERSEDTEAAQAE